MEVLKMPNEDKLLQHLSTLPDFTGLNGVAKKKINFEIEDSHAIVTQQTSFVEFDVIACGLIERRCLKCEKLFDAFYVVQMWRDSLFEKIEGVCLDCYNNRFRARRSYCSPHAKQQGIHVFESAAGKMLYKLEKDWKEVKPHA
jgi:hypothetical protein